MATPDRPVFLFQPIVPHYRIAAWQELDAMLGGNLIVIHGQSAGEDFHAHSDQTPFRTVQVKNRWVFGARMMFQPFLPIFRMFGRPYAVIAPQNPRYISTYLLLAYCKMRSVPLVFRGHGGSRKRRLAQSGHLFDRLHRFLIRSCDAFVCYTDDSRRELEEVTDSKKLFVGRNTMDTGVLFETRRSLESEGKDAVRDRLGLTHSARYLCFVGRFKYKKRADLVLDTLHELQQDGVSCGAVLIGDGPERERIMARSEELGLCDVHFPGYIADWAESAPYLYSCDVLLNPGHIGLAVNHAFSMGLPVVTALPYEQGGPVVHAPEVTYVTHGETGRFSPDLTPTSLTHEVSLVFEELDAMRTRCIRFAEEKLKLETMVQGHVDAIEYAVSKR